jgi:hypothetical protein
MAADVEMASNLMEMREVGLVVDWKELLWLPIPAAGLHDSSTCLMLMCLMDVSLEFQVVSYGSLLAARFSSCNLESIILDLLPELDCELECHMICVVSVHSLLFIICRDVYPK